MTKPITGVILLLHAMVCCYAKTISLTNTGSTSKIYITNPETYNYNPGDTFLISHSVGGLNLYNLKGAKEKYVVVIAADGVMINGGVVIATANYVKFQNLNINAGRTTIGFKAQYCSDITLDNVHVTDATIGVSIKNDPKENTPSTYYPVTINNVVINNCSVKNCNNEGFYLGHTFSSPLYGQIPSPMVGLTVTNVSVENTGWDGFQVTNAQNCKINGVTTLNTGTANQSSQKSCVALQDAVTGTFENIQCKDGTGGLTIFGAGDFVIKNVLLDHVATAKDGCAFFVDNRSDRGLKLPPRKLFAENITIKNGNKDGRFPVYVLNSTGYGSMALPGVVKNLVYNASEWPGKVVDFVPNIYTTDTASAAPPASTIEPTNPTIPVESGNSGGSIVPAEPTKPTVPEQPTNPATPESSTPTTPVESTNPTPPVESANPGGPVTPAESTKPTTPEPPASTTPVESTNSGGTVVPGEPTKPTTPEKPASPAIPVTPIDNSSLAEATLPTVPALPLDQSGLSEPGKVTKPVEVSPAPTVPPVASKNPGLIKLYSNPNNGRFRFTFMQHEKSKIQVLIVSMAGNVVYQNKWNNVDNLDEVITLPASGVYVLKVKSSDGFEDAKKVVVSR